MAERRRSLQVPERVQAALVLPRRLVLHHKHRLPPSSSLSSSSLSLSLTTRLSLRSRQAYLSTRRAGGLGERNNGMYFTRYRDLYERNRTSLICFSFVSLLIRLHLYDVETLLFKICEQYKEDVCVLRTELDSYKPIGA